MKIKYASIASAICASLFAGHAAAAPTFGGFGTAAAGTAEGTEIRGTILVAPEAVTWARANGSAIINTGSVTPAALSNGNTQLSVTIPSAGGANQEHTIVALRTINAHKGGTATFAANTGVQIDVMNGTNPVTPSRSESVSGLVGTRHIMPLPVLDATSRTTIGTISLPMYAAALEQTGADGATSQTIGVCTGNGSIIRGNAIPTTGSSGNTSVNTYNSTRTMFANAGLRSQSDAINAINAAGTNTTPTTATLTAQPASVCNKPTAANTAFLYDHGLFLQNVNQHAATIVFSAPITAETSWTVPINVRVQYI